MPTLGPDYSYIYRKINKLTMIGFTGTVRKKIDQGVSTYCVNVVL